MATLHVSRDPEEDESCLIFSDPAIKLFGRTIFLPNSTIATAADHFPGPSPQPFGSNTRVANTQSEFKFESDEDCLSPRGVDELGTTSGNSVGSDEEDLPSPSLSKESIIDETGLGVVHAEGGQNGRGEVEKTEKPSSLGSAQEKSLRKPEKVAPCPRCNSLDTKFCYFNNYNVNQPRHFCKCCQRYWTDGGTLRNVPVGAGRRKNKHGNQHKQALPDAVFFRREEHEVAQPLLPCSLPQEVGWTSGVVKPICSAPVLHFPPSLESVYFTDSSPAQSALSTSTQEIHFSGNMASQFTFGAGAVRGPSLPIYDSYRVVKVEVKSGESPQLRPKSLNDSSEVGNITEVTMTTATDGKDDCVCSSTTSASETALNSDCDGGISTKPSLLCGTPSPPPPFFGMPWPYSYVSWTAAAAAAAAAAGGDRSSQGIFTSASQTETPASVGAAEGLWQWPHIPVAMWSPNGWNVPLTHPMAMAAVSAVPVPVRAPAPAASTSAAVKENSSGKRPRASSEGMAQGSLCIPKTLRIRDPGEAAQSSILTTLGVAGKSGSLLSTGFFTAFQPKAEVFQPNPGKSLPPQPGQMPANPPAAASSSSIASHEGK